MKTLIIFMVAGLFSVGIANASSTHISKRLASTSNHIVQFHTLHRWCFGGLFCFGG